MDKLRQLLDKKRKLAGIFGVDDQDILSALLNILLSNAETQKSNNKNFENIATALKNIIENQQEDKKIYELLEKVIKSTSDKTSKIINMDEFPKEIAIKNFSELHIPEDVSIKNISAIKFPHELTIKNLSDIIFPGEMKISNLGDMQFPPEISISKPKWYEIFDKKWLSREISDLALSFKKSIEKFAKDIIVKNKEPKEAIPVRLVSADGKEFYNAQSGKSSGGMFISENGLSYGKIIKKIAPINVGYGSPAVYELPVTDKYLCIQNKGSAIVAFGDSNVTYDDYPTLTPRQFYEFIDCKPGFKVYFKCDSGKSATIVGFTR